MLTLNDLIKDEESIEKYASNLIHAKIGNAQLTKKWVSFSPSDQRNIIKDFKIHEDIQHLKKLIVGEKRILELEDFPEISDKMLHFGYTIPTVSISKESDDVEIDALDNSSYIIEISSFRMKVNIPSVLEEDTLLNLLYKQEEISNDCWVWWNGTSFLAYTIDGKSPDMNFAHRARDVLVGLCKDSDTLDVTMIGPTPIHPDLKIYIFSREKLRTNLEESEINNIQFSPLKHDDDIIINVIVQKEADVKGIVHQAAKALFSSLNSDIELFYRAMAIRSKLMHTTGMCGSRFESLSNCLLSVNKLSTRAFLEKSKKISELERLSTEISMLLVKEYEISVSLKEAQQLLLLDLSKKRINALLSDYISEHSTEPTRLDRQSISNALLHTDQVLGRQHLFNTQVFSAIIGAIIGGIIAVALMYIGVYLSNLNSS